MELKGAKKYCVSIFWVCLLCSCIPASHAGPTLTEVPATQSTLLPTVENTPTSTPDLKAEWLKNIVFSKCLEIEDLPKDNEIPWIVLGVRGIVPFSIDPNTGIKSDRLLPSQDLIGNSYFADDFYISPDGKWLAYHIYLTDSAPLIVEPSSNILTNSSQQRMVIELDSPVGLGGWFNNELVFFVSSETEDGFGKTIILNPFTKQQYEFSLDVLPDHLYFQPGMSGSHLFHSSNLMPDVTMKRVAYPAIVGDRFYIMLWDIENKKNLVSLKLHLAQWFNDPLWSLDGKDFLIMGFDEKDYVEWFRVDRNGAVQQITYFGDFLKDAEIEMSSRSWDGRYLAFQLFYNAGANAKYIVLDLTVHPMDGFCIDAIPSNGGILPSPMWSPDNHYLAITDGEETDSWRIVMVDVDKRKAFQIPEKVAGVGWIARP